METTQAQLKVAGGKTITVEIPTDEEITRIAMRMHTAGKACLETILGCKVLYRPREERAMTLTEVDPFSDKQGQPSAPRKFSTPAEFTFGYDGPWHIVLSWKNGDDKPPEWFRYDDNLIRETQGALFGGGDIRVPRRRDTFTPAHLNTQPEPDTRTDEEKRKAAEDEYKKRFG